MHPKMNGRRILLVDDYPDVLQVWSASLNALGYDVLTANTGEQGLEVAQSELPEAIVLDLDLPGISGCELARILKRLPATGAIPLIAATGTSYAPRLDEARRSGFDVILIKPCDVADLVIEIEKLLDHPVAAARARVPSGKRHAKSG